MKDRLVTRDYCLILAANFLLYFAFYLILPILPFYLTEIFHTGNAAVGIILSCYTVASLCIRPFSGYLLDTLARKPLYLIAYFVFISIFAGYIDIIRPVENSTRAGIRYGNSSRKYDCNRHYPILTTRRSSRILWTDE